MLRGCSGFTSCCLTITNSFSACGLIVSIVATFLTSSSSYSILSFWPRKAPGAASGIVDAIPCPCRTSLWSVALLSAVPLSASWAVSCLIICASETEAVCLGRYSSTRLADCICTDWFMSPRSRVWFMRRVVLSIIFLWEGLLPCCLASSSSLNCLSRTGSLRPNVALTSGLLSINWRGAVRFVTSFLLV